MRRFFTVLFNSTVFLIILTNTCQAYGQTEKLKIDSLLKSCEQISISDPEKARDIAQEALKLSTEMEYKEGEAQADFHLGKALAQLNETDQAIEYFKKSYVHYTALNDAKGKTLSLKEIGNAYYNTNQNDKSFTFYDSALSIAQNANIKREIITINNNIGALHDRQKNYEKAIEYYQISLNLNSEEELKATVQGNMAQSYANTGDYDKAIELYQKSLKICNDLNDDNCRFDILDGMSSTYWMMENDRKVLEISFQLLDILKNTGDKRNTILTYNRIGLSYLNLGKTEESIPYFKYALKYANEINYYYKHLILANLAFAYERTGQFDRAYDYLLKHKKLSDSIQSLENEKKIDELLTKYEADKKEKEITLLQKERELQEAKLKNKQTELERQKVMQFSFMLGSLLILVASIVLFVIYRQKIRNKEMLALKTEEVNKQKIREMMREQEISTIKAQIEGQENERNRIARELHDGVAGTLAGIKLNLTKISEQYPDDKKLNKAIKNIDMTYQEVRSISHHLTPPKILSYSFIQLIRDHVRHISANSSFETELICYPEEELNQLSNEIKIEIYRIIQELMNNVFKHSEADFVEIQFTKNNQNINLIVEDNGKGYDTKGDSGGIGLSSISSRVQLLKGELHIDSVIGRGTIVNINIPFTKRAEKDKQLV